ncbi:P-loop containing nucleoside triphosphate hydrolase protein [Catenaria anguillulae PL171]|uniref:p-loop containing nucleoside triphosphate hydrolase protein n=1 Tax=Catenaria anguillulae PL171 TaxID=765915 RepID=A0A1Y2HMD7_9FUNG|nr:P-loop containing nucleoside triphosphate hydrolase protein [Catenaria anguillulae PL171]
MTTSSTPPTSTATRPAAVDTAPAKDGQYTPVATAPQDAVANDAKPSDAAVAGTGLPSPPPVSFTALFRYANSTDRFFMIAGMVAAAVMGSGMPLMTLVFGDITESFNNFYTQSLLLPPGDPRLIAGRKNLESEIIRNILYFVAIGAGAFLCSYLSKALWMAAGERQAKRIRELYLKSVLRQDMAFFDSTAPGDITTRLTADVALVQDGISEKVSLTAQFVFTFIASFVIAFLKSAKLTGVLLAATPLLAASGAFMAKLIGEATNKSQASYASAGAIAQEALQNIRTVVAFGGQQRLSEAYDKNLIGAYKVNTKKALYAGAGLGIMMLFMFSTYALAFWYGATLVKVDEINGGTVITVFFAVMIGAFSLGNSGPNIQVIATARGAAAKVYSVIERVPSIDTSSEEGVRVTELKGDIEFRNVSFHYPSRPDIPILKNFSLKIKAGENVALVGQSGSGKSTLIQLLERFYDPVEGEVLVDGRNIKEYHLQSYRQCIGLVQQEPVLFDATISENVALGAREGVQVSRDQIIEVCKLSNAAKFIEKLPEGYDTPVGERGALLSGGQKQRVAIARAVISQCKILLLDEATSALDTESERVVQDALDRASQGRTTITIAHRLSTIRDCDNIVVMRRGEIVEAGHHDDLLASQGYYSELVKAQEVRTKEDGDSKADSPVDVDAVVLATTVADNHLDASGNRSTVVAVEMEPLVGKSSDAKASASHGKLAAASTGDVTKDGEKKSSEGGVPNLDDPEVLEALAKEAKVDMLRLFKMQAPEAFIIFCGIIAAALNGAHMPLFSIFFSKILNVFANPDKDQMQRDANFWSLMFVLLAVAMLFINLFQHSLFGIAGERLTKRVRSMSFRAMLRQNIAFFDEKAHGTGALAHQLSDEADRIQGLTGVFAGQLIQLIITMVAGLTIAFVYSWKLTLIILACVPFMAAAGALQMKVMSGSGAQITRAYSRAAQVTVDALGNIRTVHALTRQQFFYAQYKERIMFPHNVSMRKAWIGNLGSGFADGVVFWVYGAAFYAMYRLVFDDGLNVGDGFVALYAVVFAAMGTGQMSALGPNAAKARIAAAGMFKLLDRVPPIDSESNEGEQRTDIAGNASVSDVHFSYPTRPDAQILRGFNAHMDAGKTIALCGASGGGKSTVIGLIERWYDAGQGSVKVEDLDVKSWHLGNLRSHMALVAQMPDLFALSILENIRFGKPDASLEEVIAAAKVANIHAFIDSLPNKYDTPITGAQVSGGQKQRIAIARAVLRNPRILLLDEATSALDSEAERVVQDALDRAAQDRTTIIIAHRLSTIQNADHILCLKDGVVVEQGTHDELYAANGLYTSLVNNQRLGGV